MVKGISSADLGKPDYDLALQQHENYIQALELCGLKVSVLEPNEDFPDSTFVEDVCLMTPGCAVITRPGASTRRDEIVHIEPVVTALGRPVERIQAPGTLDAGDIMMVGGHYYAGLSDRTNPEGASQLKQILEKYNLSSSTIRLEEVLHLKTGISYLENNNLLAFGEFLTKPELKDFHILKVNEDESYAANSVWINGKVLVPAGFPTTARLIASAGYEIVEVDVSEFQKLDGGLSCLSLRF